MVVRASRQNLYEEFVMNQYEYERKKEKHVNGLAGSIVGVL